jgi:hypothetical protein
MTRENVHRATWDLYCSELTLESPGIMLAKTMRMPMALPLLLGAVTTWFSSVRAKPTFPSYR